VAANPSPLGVKLHDAGYAELGLDFKYIALGSEDIAPVVSSVRTLGVRGLGVSMPHKITALELLDELSPDVLAIGATNTVVNEDGRLVGHNTDWQGAVRALDEKDLGHCATALVVGAGGVARAIAYGLTQRGTKVTIAARDLSRGEALVSDLGLDSAVLLEDQAEVEAELVVNATPAADAVALEDLSPKGVFDVLFSTRSTPLTQAAESRGIPAVAGWRMLLLQAAAQFELYTGEAAPLEAMSDVLEAALPDS